jgi:hypothetical protein
VYRSWSSSLWSFFHSPVISSFFLCLCTPGKVTRCPCHKRLGGSKERSRQERKISPQLGNYIYI